VDAARNLIFVCGSVPGPNNGFVEVRTARTGIVKVPVAKPAAKAAAGKGKK
jgi:ribosomal protein L3